MQSSTFDALEKALAPIEHIGQEELTFEADGVKVTLRVMLPEEENEVQRYASKALPAPLGDEESEKIDGIDQLDYIERFKLAVLSHALVAVGDSDFRDLKYVETDEKLENDKNVSIEKHVAMRKILFKWSGALRTLMFQKYSDLLDIMEAKAEKAIEFEPSDITTEIQRLERNLKRLKEKQANGPRSARSPLKSQVQSIAESEKPFAESAADSTSPQGEELEKTQTQETQVSLETDSDHRQPITPPVVNVPPARSVSPPLPPSPQPVSPEEIPSQQGGTPIPVDMPGSLVDTSDTDGLRAAVAEEEARIIKRRQEASADPTLNAPSLLNDTPVQEAVQRPPHVDAAEVAASAVPEGGFKEAGNVGGVKAFRLPPESLTRNQAQQAPKERLEVNPSKPQGSRNPRFVSPRK